MKCPRCLEEQPLITKEKALEWSERAVEWRRGVVYLTVFCMLVGGIATVLIGISVFYFDAVFPLTDAFIAIAFLVLAAILMAFTACISIDKRYYDLLYRFLKK